MNPILTANCFFICCPRCSLFDVAKAAFVFDSVLSQLKQTAIDTSSYLSIVVIFKHLRKKSFNWNCFTILLWITFYRIWLLKNVPIARAFPFIIVSAKIALWTMHNLKIDDLACFKLNTGHIAPYLVHLILNSVSLILNTAGLILNAWCLILITAGLILNTSFHQFYGIQKGIDFSKSGP